MYDVIYSTKIGQKTNVVRSSVEKHSLKSVYIVMMINARRIFRPFYESKTVP